jgi:hypothetical protein
MERLMQTRAARCGLAAVAAILLGIVGAVAIDSPLKGRLVSPSFAAEGADTGASVGGPVPARFSVYRSVWRTATNEQLRALLQSHAQIGEWLVFEGLDAWTSHIIGQIFLADENLGREMLHRLAGRTTAEQIRIFEDIKQVYRSVLNAAGGTIYSEVLQRVGGGLDALTEHLNLVRSNEKVAEENARRARAEQKNQKKQASQKKK